MAAGEKNSLRKIIKNAHAHQVNTFRLHYFPHIPTPGERIPYAGPGDNAGPASQGATDLEASTNGAVAAGSGSGQATGKPAKADRHPLEATAKQAYAEGFAQGERDATHLAEERIAPLMATLQSVLAELTTMRQKRLSQIENEVIDLALHIGRKIVGQALQTNRDAVAGIVREALKHTEDLEKICIRLNPEDLRHLRQTPGFENVKASERVQLEGDNAIDSGGCLVQTEYGEIDARIEEQFRTIEEAFRAEMMGLSKEA